jgi:hypothetical protein
MKKALVGVLGAALLLVAAPSHQAIMLSFAHDPERERSASRRA